VVGSGSVQVAQALQGKSAKSVEIIVEDYDSLMNSKLSLTEVDSIQIKLMDFERTDYDNETFDLVFAQGSISNYRRNKTVKELKRILKSESYFCVGEVIKLQNEVPIYVDEIFENSDINPMLRDELKKYYSDRNLELIDQLDISFTLNEYYSTNEKMLRKKIVDLSDNEKSYYKKLVNKISHESKAYLRHGADKFIGFEALLLKKI
ncbi:MAG: class I SAM-dependent methyltransferase, partial [Ignavibacteriae bacterium]|nr:class I SAM-dependent methyltransferase [Ignavibacteriota bacterium]